MESLPRSTGILLAEGRFPIRHADSTADCLCQVTFDLTRERHVLIDCLESAHKLQPGFIPPKGPFFLEPSPGAKPIECLVFRMNGHVIGGGPDLRLTLLPSSSTLVDRGLPIVRVNAGIVNFNQYWFGGPGRRDSSVTGGSGKFGVAHPSSAPPRDFGGRFSETSRS